MTIDLNGYSDRLIANGNAYLREYLRTHRPSNTARLHKKRGAVEAAAIMACIANGVTETDQLVQTAARISGSSTRMVYTILYENNGADPKRHLWFEEMPIPFARRFALHNQASLLKTVR